MEFDNRDSHIYIKACLTCPRAMTIAQLQEMKPLLNLAELARRAGMNEQTLFAKVRRGSELTVIESEKLEVVLEAADLLVKKRSVA